MFWDYIYYALFFALPLLTVVFFGVSLFRYLSARNANKKQPNAFSADEMKKRKLIFVISSVVAGVFVAIVIGVISLLCMAIAFM
jgi:hypothetical protein